MSWRRLKSRIPIIAMSLGCLLLFDKAWAASFDPLLINQIAIDPKNPRIIYAAARPQGVLKSTDRGVSWHPAREGLKNTSVYHIVIDPADPKILYLGTFGGGIYKSKNAGKYWSEVNQGLGNTNIHALLLNPLQSDQIVVSTSTGELFKSDNGGKSWTPFNEGLPAFPGDIIATFIIFPGDPAGFYLAQGSLFMRPFSSSLWQEVGQNFPEQPITALAYDPLTRAFFAGTMKAGLFKAVLGLNPMATQSRLNWTPIGQMFKNHWIRFIALDPSNSGVIYVTAVEQGILKSTNHGESWREINTGLPEKNVESLAIDPQDSRLLYAGTHNHGLFVSRDGGESWQPPANLEVEPATQIIASLSSQTHSAQSQKPRFVPPPSFSKCNRCHGWTDPVLNQKSTFWRVPPNRRDWQPTVQRMSRGAGLTSNEEEEIIRFLTQYSNQQTEDPGP
jgi:photosystem II stability/assembly factor-like uncharacterized protein